MSFGRWKSGGKVFRSSGSQVFPLYGFGAIGVLIYYFQQATGVGDVLVAVVKALFWPGFLLYEVYGFLGMS